MRNWIYGLILTVIVAVITAFVTYRNVDKIDRLVGYEPTCESQNNTVKNYPETDVFTVQDYLKFRNGIKEDKRKDSIFLAMPEVILVNILENIGTDLTSHEIVDIYERYRDVYDKVLSGANSQITIETIKDSLNTIP